MEKEFSVGERAKSFTHAWRGLGLFLRTTHSAWIQIGIFALVVVAGSLLQITKIEWMFLMFAGGLVLSAEAFNTALEIDMDLTSPQYHPAARDTKDIAAGAVLIASITASIIGLFIFLPHLATLF